MKETGVMEELWKGVLFNQFHDTMGGTIIESAREEAVMQLGGVCAKAGQIRALAMQRMANLLDTSGEGFPLILFNASSYPFAGEVETELEWFCQSPLKLLSPEEKEISYQRIHTDAKVRHTTLGGRRRFVFEAEIPPFGFAVYRVCKEEPSLASNQEMEILNPDSDCLENRFLRADFDRSTGNLVSLVEKETGYDALQKPARLVVYRDERDAWGGLQGRVYERTDEELSLVSMEKIESGPLREAIRVRQKGEKIELEQRYILGKNDRELRVECRLKCYRQWTLLKTAYPLTACCPAKAEAVTALAESAYGTLRRQIGPEDSSEYYMHRFVDLQDEAGAGLYVANDGKYGFHLADKALQITVCRSHMSPAAAPWSSAFFEGTRQNGLEGERGSALPGRQRSWRDLQKGNGKFFLRGYAKCTDCSGKKVRGRRSVYPPSSGNGRKGRERHPLGRGIQLAYCDFA